MEKYAIIAIGYNREVSMQRLLHSLSLAEYGNDNVTLIISIDNSGSDAVEKCADCFEWKYGEKRIITYPKRQGLRKHILKCGDYVNEFDAIAVFEDDIIAAPSYYQYMKKAVKKYENDDNIAGISLYSHLWNVNVNKPFEAAYTKYDCYFMQFAQSWGQIWMKKQWFEFKKWYEVHNEEFGENEKIPRFVSGWPKTSWLKYHIKYCIENRKYFVYPYKSLTTCFSDIGEHCFEKDTHLQVPMIQGIKYDYDFPEYGDMNAAYYDAFFEREMKGDIESITGSKICVDLYGSRTSYLNQRYVLSTFELPYKIIKGYALELRPHEVNVINDIPGNAIFLYDTLQTEKRNSSFRNSKNEKISYYFRLYGNGKNLVQYIINKTTTRIRKRKQK